MKNNSADLRTFLLTLQSDNELISIKRDVNTEYEIAAVSTRSDGKQAVLFEKTRGVRSESYAIHYDCKCKGI